MGWGERWISGSWKGRSIKLIDRMVKAGRIGGDWLVRSRWLIKLRSDRDDRQCIGKSLDNVQMINRAD